MTIDPIRQFQNWLQTSREKGCLIPDAMALATVGADGRPSVRMVLFKGIAPPDRLCIVTHLGSRKAVQMTANPFAAAVFHWTPWNRQVRFEGQILPMPRPDVEAYFRTRPRGSQIGACASPQSSPIPDRAWLEEHVRALERKYEGREVPCPVDWGGFHLVPLRVEFWVEGHSRLHERSLFERATSHDTSWKQSILAP